MKIPKHYIGKEVRITWLDPYSSERMKLADVKKGRAALAKWRERGVITDLTDGVVLLVQSEAYSPEEDKPDEGIVGSIPEELIESCEVMAPEPAGSS